MKNYTLVGLLLTLAALNQNAAHAATNAAQRENNDEVNISTKSVENRISRISELLKTTEDQNQEDLIARGWLNGKGRSGWVNGRGRGWIDGRDRDWINTRYGGWLDGDGRGFANSNRWRNGWSDRGGFWNYR